MLSYTSKQARDDFSTVLSQVAFGGERILITRQGKTVAAVVPMSDLEMLEKLQDFVDLEEAKDALAEAHKKGTVSWNSLKIKLGL